MAVPAVFGGCDVPDGRGRPSYDSSYDSAAEVRDVGWPSRPSRPSRPSSGAAASDACQPSFSQFLIKQANQHSVTFDDLIRSRSSGLTGWQQQPVATPFEASDPREMRLAYAKSLLTFVHLPFTRMARVVPLGSVSVWRPSAEISFVPGARSFRCQSPGARIVNLPPELSEGRVRRSAPLEI